jgi:membrane protease YdiL (CAAX protease family)
LTQIVQPGNSVGSVAPVRTLSRAFEFFLFFIALLWAGTARSIAGRAAQGISLRFNLESLEQLLESAFFLFLLVVGIQALDWVVTRRGDTERALPLPGRPSRLAEWGTGAAVGWGLCLAAVVPVLLSGSLHASMSLGAGSLAGLAVALVTLLIATLGTEAVFRGYIFQRLIRAIGPTGATLLLSAIFSISLVNATSLPHHLLLALLDGFLLGVVLSAGWLRTHGLWLPWGLHFGYRAVMAIALGLPLAGRGVYYSLLDSYTTGPRWLTGGAFGLDAALLTGPIFLLGFAILFPLTRNWAWNYTHREILPAGYEVAVQPPAAHTAMESQAPAGVALVQILPAAPARHEDPADAPS